MKTIWKYELEITDEQEIKVPKGAKFLSVDFQGNSGCLWALVDSRKPKVTRTIAIKGTGNPIDPYEDLSFIGTFQMRKGSLVWHVFEKK